MKLVKIRFHQNRFGNIRALCGRRAIKSFGGSAFDAEYWASLIVSRGHIVVGLEKLFNVYEK